LGQVGKNRPSNQFVRAINQAEYCQSLLPMPRGAVLAGVKGPRVGPGSVLVGQGNERVWVSGVGAEEQLKSHGCGQVTHYQKTRDPQLACISLLRR